MVGTVAAANQESSAGKQEPAAAQLVESPTSPLIGALHPFAELTPLGMPFAAPVVSSSSSSRQGRPSEGTVQHLSFCLHVTTLSRRARVLQLEWPLSASSPSSDGPPAATSAAQVGSRLQGCQLMRSSGTAVLQDANAVSLLAALTTPSPATSFTYSLILWSPLSLPISLAADWVLEARPPTHARHRQAAAAEQDISFCCHLCQLLKRARVLRLEWSELTAVTGGDILVSTGTCPLVTPASDRQYRVLYHSALCDMTKLPCLQCNVSRGHSVSLSLQHSCDKIVISGRFESEYTSRITCKYSHPKHLID